MNFQLADNNEKKGRSCADGYIDAMQTLMGNRENIVHINCDLMDRIHVDRLGSVFPTRVINVGPAEQNAMGVAAGMTASGLNPFVHSAASFASRKMLDQAYLSAQRSHLPVHVVGSNPGITVGLNGSSHMAFEDCALYMTIPDAIVIDPCDYTQTKALTEQTADCNGLSYMRLCCDECKEVYKKGAQFEIGKGVMLRDGTDVAIIASGIMVAEALRTAEQLEKEDGVYARVIDMHTWKPLDLDIIRKAAAETGCIVVAENHNEACGLGAAIETELMNEKIFVPVIRAGLDVYDSQTMRDYLLHQEKSMVMNESLNIKNGVQAAQIALSLMQNS